MEALEWLTRTGWTVSIVQFTTGRAVRPSRVHAVAMRRGDLQSAKGPDMRQALVSLKTKVEGWEQDRG